MALQASGAISLSQIQTNFGGTNPISLSSFYRGTNSVTNNNTNVPTSGTISLGKFYSASRRDIVYVGGLGASYGGGGGTKTITITGALTGGVAISPSVGDLVVLAWCVSSTGNESAGLGVTTPIGWTVWGTDWNDSPSSTTSTRGQDTNMAWAYKFWEAGDSTVTFIVSTSTNNAAAAVIQVYRNVRPNSGNPISGAGGTDRLHLNNASATITPPPLATPSWGWWGVTTVGFGNNDSSTLTAPANLLNVISVNGNDYRDARVAIGYYPIPIPSLSLAINYQPSNWTMATAVDRAPISATFSLRPD